ncbi:MAG: hypothetical protein JWO19_2604 [Bryobacterales bacterium]|nr:hypothetical protein [Bryobacterales bacterium]
MSSGKIEENTHSERLRKDYKGAFDEWALQISRLQAITSDSTDMKEAEERAAAAEIAYRDSRDRLTDDMGWTPPTLSEPDPNE